MDELIVFLMREFGWTLAYTKKLVKTLPIKKLNALIKETQYQKAMDDYKQSSCAAMIVACLTSDKQHRRNVRDIIGDPPSREGKSEAQTLKGAAEKEGIILPKE